MIVFSSKNCALNFFWLQFVGKSCINRHYIRRFINVNFLLIFSEGAIFKKSILKFPGKENQQLYILHIDESDFSSSGLFWAVPNYPPAISYVYGEFKDKIEEYCEAFDEGYSYLPRKFEICFALYEGRVIAINTPKCKCYLCYFKIAVLFLKVNGLGLYAWVMKEQNATYVFLTMATHQLWKRTL